MLGFVSTRQLMLSKKFESVVDREMDVPRQSLP